MFIKKPLAKGYLMTLTKLKIGAAAPDHPLPHHSGKSWRRQKGFNPRTRFLFATLALPDRIVQRLVIMGHFYFAPLRHDHFAPIQLTLCA
jgi:hypothetical protein